MSTLEPSTPSRLHAPTLYKYLLLLGILAFLLILKVRFARLNQALGTDGALYFDVADNVSRGLGLVTDAALFNAGFAYFPHETVLYPLWPLLLGHFAHWMPLSTAAHVLPTIFYGLSLLLAYRLAQRLFPDPLVPEILPVFNAGHAAVLLLGLNPGYFISTSRPFTEGLSYTLLLLLFLRVERLLSRPSSLRALEVGLWAGLLVLARSQLVLAGGVLLGFLGLRALILRQDWRIPLLAALGMGLIGAEQWLFIATFVDAPPLHLLLRFDLHRDASALPVIPVMVKTDGLWSWMLDRAKGIPVAYGAGRRSFVHSLGPMALSMLICLPFLLRSLWQWFRHTQPLSGERLKSAWIQLRAWMEHPQTAFAIYMLCFALVGWASLHSIHKANFAEWNFGTRHGLTAIFLAFAALIYLLRQPGLGKAIGLSLLIGSSAVTADRIERVLEKMPRPLPRTVLAQATPLSTWLVQERQRRGQLRVVVEDGWTQDLAARTRDIGYYWIYRKSTLTELLVFFETLGASYLILPTGRYDAHAMMSPLRLFRAQFMLIQQLDGFDVYVWRARATSEQREVEPAPCVPDKTTMTPTRNDEP
ncbi:MAG: hypothetical protein ACKO6N_14390 [Myxococcota bacterium]